MLCHAEKFVGGLREGESKLVIAGSLRFETANCRRMARRFGLGMDAGMVDMFEIRFSLSPYSELRIPDMEPCPERDQCLDAFMRQPRPCLPLFAQRLLHLYPTRDALETRGPPIWKALSESTMMSVDACERGHAAVRVDITSSGAGRSSTASANRVYCRSVSAAHNEAGGMMPTSAKEVVKLIAPQSAAHSQAPSSDGAVVAANNIRSRTPQATWRSRT